MSFHDQELISFLLRFAFAGDGTVLGISLAVVAAQTWFKFHSRSTALKQIRRIPSVPISDIRSVLTESESENDDDGNDVFGGKLVAVRGQVQSKSSVEGSWRSFKENLLVSPDSGERGVVIQKTQTCLYHEWRGLASLTSDWRVLFGRTTQQQVVTSFKTVPFVLLDDESWPQAGYVTVNLKDSKQPIPLTTVYQHLSPIRASPFTVFQALFGHGYPIGVLDEEKILPPGKVVTAVGCCSLKNGVPEIKSCNKLPVFLSDLTKEQLIDNLASGVKILLWGGIILSTLSIGALSFAIIRNWGRLKDWHRRRTAQHEEIEPPSVTNPEDESGDVPDGELCVICLMRQRRSAFIPCGHMVCCPRCALMVERDMNPKCPVCRQAVRNSLRIYDS